LTFFSLSSSFVSSIPTLDERPFMGLVFSEVPTVLQSLGSNDFSGEPAMGLDRGADLDRGSSLNLNSIIGILKRRFFYFLLPFGLVSIFGLYLAAIQQPSYLSEGKILIEAQAIDPDILRPVLTSAGSERIQLIQQRITTRDTLLSVANKLGLFPELPPSVVVELMRKSLQMKPVMSDGNRGTSTLALTVGFESDSAELAMRVANEFVSLLVGEDARSRTNRATEAVKILTDEAKETENKLVATQMQLLAIASRPRDTVPEIPEQQKLDLTALAAARAELVQKSAVYSDAHPAVLALKKKIAAMEKNLTRPSKAQTQSQSIQAETEEVAALKRQRDALENRLGSINGKLVTARLGENDQLLFQNLQVIELPSLPQRPKSSRLKTAGTFFAAAMGLGIGVAFGIEWLGGSIRARHELAGVVPSQLIVCIPYIETRADIIRTRLRILVGVIGVVVILAAWGGLATAIVLKWPVDFLRLPTAETGIRTADR
jgi:uncharacterized protein involved in exopolysaccharide biosynthesis